MRDVLGAVDSEASRRCVSANTASGTEMMTMIKKIGRWIIRRDAESTGIFAGWIVALQPVFAAVVGIQTGLINGLLVYFGLYVVRIIVGHADYRYIRATKYRNDYVGNLAPATVIIKEKKEKRYPTDP